MGFVEKKKNYVEAMNKNQFNFLFDKTRTKPYAIPTLDAQSQVVKNHPEKPCLEFLVSDIPFSPKNMCSTYYDMRAYPTRTTEMQNPPRSGSPKKKKKKKKSLFFCVSRTTEQTLGFHCSVSKERNEATVYCIKTVQTVMHPKQL